MVSASDLLAAPRFVTTDIGLAEPLSDLEWDWLHGFLLSRAGVRGALYLREPAARIRVKHDVRSLTRAGLIDLLYLYGVYPDAGTVTALL